MCTVEIYFKNKTVKSSFYFEFFFANTRNWVFANSYVLIAISLQPDGVILWCFKLRLFDLTERKKDSNPLFKLKVRTKPMHFEMHLVCWNNNVELVFRVL